jgi:hypothetical protein
LRYGQRKGARDMRQNLILVDLIGTDGIHAGSISETWGNSIMAAAPLCCKFATSDVAHCH